MAASGDEAAAAAGRADNVEAVGNSVDKEGEKMNGSNGEAKVGDEAGTGGGEVEEVWRGMGGEM